ncbi:MAG: phosphoribosylanthranilate isomerase [Planctomycetia bacterium]|uniref:N-(5'-phosphoribosyl)anthranilate isomerase n=1 Tax=Candidatus Brocadia sapporoensis TaxID=392547 RepID=A0A1V6LYT6_9BACT|nr:phosphoribosylanthranilate isomerase [Candidatus Brocadia sapporoensis]OQD45334.1 N-(5'-phosphoribosyl)anthranilate isomerase [Candidatus Brocadia sapporoensis]QOJ07111.1 MAG: phosphoribosylanthranilate isomerase [Planctomycetia bacterium]GJQ24663.1 MAG: N-(5'-phosphoribosyl)anthranilate isomerase [Candidatus Brocadia sapporoensis]HQU31421.1 phosphoribosylanthranilate isomerase [Candidatus Brocadia sapporoensis]
MMRVKICGITNSEDAQDAVALGADALGFVFAKSSRRVTKERAKDIIEHLPPFVSPVGVFVDEAVEAIKGICNFCSIHTVQLHGNEDPLYVYDLKGYTIVKAFRIREEDDLEPLANYKPHAFLLDSYVKGVMGGTGVPFKWEIARQAHKYGTVILSGGLTPENVREAIHIVQPYAVDVSSGVESSPGKKNKVLMKRFIMNAKFQDG